MPHEQRIGNTMTTIQKSEPTTASGTAGRAAQTPLTVTPPQMTLSALLSALNALQARGPESPDPLPAPPLGLRGARRPADTA